MIVVDASLATKLVIGEIDSDRAHRWYLAAQHDLVAPDLIAIEVAQAVVRQVNSRHAIINDGRAALQAWRVLLDAGGIGLLRIQPAHVDEAADLAMRLGHPLKDCVYLTLAIELHCELATCDVKFADKARGIYPAVRLLSDYADIDED